MQFYSIEEAKRIIPKSGGIYIFRNKENKKCYVGQAKNLRKRFFRHLRLVNTKCAPLYKAMFKHGLLTFEYAIIIHNDNNEQLDLFEKEYIIKYNSYGSTGYNQTKGGDGGILGYKMTTAQREKVSLIRRNQVLDGRYKIFIYNIEDETIKEYLNIAEAEKLLHENAASIRSYFSHNDRLLYNSKYIIKRSVKELEDAIELYKN